MWSSATILSLAASITLVGAGCGEEKAADQSQPTSAALHDLASNPVHILRKAPHVAEVKRHGPDAPPTHRIVHIADWHFVERDDYAADLRSLSDEPISDEDIDRRFAELLDEVERVQDQQMAVLRWLIKQHGLKRVHIEGLTKRDQFIIDAKIRVLRNVGKELAELRQENSELLSESEPDDKTQEIIDGIRQLEEQYHRDLLQLGAAGRLVLSGELEGVLPLEDEKAYQAANPVAEDGSVIFDQKKIEARQDGQVRLLLDNGPFAVITLGGAHDLSDNVERLSDGKAEYIRVEVAEWKKVAGED